MRINMFNFPTFEEWVKRDKELKIEIGAYRCEIRRFAWSEIETTYMFAVSLSNVNPLNIYTDKLFCKSSFGCANNTEMLKKWYYDTIEEFNTFWENHITSTYFNGE